MIERTETGFVIRCDRCSSEHEVDGEFMEAVQEVKDLGWHITKENGDWKHTCPLHNG